MALLDDIEKARLRLTELLHKYDDAVTDTVSKKPQEEENEERDEDEEEEVDAALESKSKVELPPSVEKALTEAKDFEPAKFIFVSADGDDIGSKVEQKVMANDLEGIIRQSEVIKQGQSYIKSSFETLDGRMLVHGGDDNLAVVSSEHLGKLEQIRKGYKEMTGFTVTFGVGNTMREAVKALVYGKLTGKDKLVLWTDNLNAELEQLAQPQSEQAKLVGHGLLPEDIATKTTVAGVKEKLVGGMGDGHPATEFDPKQVAMGTKVEMEHTKDPKVAEEISRDHLAEVPDYYDRLADMEDGAKKEGKKRKVITGAPGTKSKIKK